MTEQKLTQGAPTMREARGRAADEATQERGDRTALTHVQAPTYLRATHPEHGEPVTFVPGEALPAWVVDALDAGRFTRLRDGVIEVADPQRKASR